MGTNLFLANFKSSSYYVDISKWKSKELSYGFAGTTVMNFSTTIYKTTIFNQNKFDTRLWGPLRNVLKIKKKCLTQTTTNIEKVTVC